MATININLTPASVAEINTGTNNNKIVTALGLETSKYSAWIHAGTTVRLTTSTDKVGMGLAVPTHKLHIVSSVTDTMMVTGSVDTGKNAGIEIDADVFGQGILKGSSIFYNENSAAEIYYAFAGSESGVGSAQVGYLNTSTGATSLFVATAADAGMAVNIDGGNEVLAVVFDPAGTKIAGKDTGAVNYTLQTYKGNPIDYAGARTFAVRNDGRVTIDGLAGNGAGYVAVDNSGNLSWGSGGSLGYLVYTALLTQTGTNAPVATVLQNTLGGTPVWGYDTGGGYTVTLANAFTVNKTAVFIGLPAASSTTLFGISAATMTSSLIYLEAISGNDQLLNTPFEIRVYP